jgi:hypothetical protein
MSVHVRNNQYLSTAKKIREKVDEFFEKRLPDTGDTLTSIINNSFQLLNPAFEELQ